MMKLLHWLESLEIIHQKDKLGFIAFGSHLCMFTNLTERLRYEVYPL